MKANTICKYSQCKLGPNGTRKHYYSCGYCAAAENWKSMACCREHYQLYLEEVRSARERGLEVDLLPHRTDLSREEIRSLKKRPLEQVKRETEAELRDYADERGEIHISEAVEQINRELEKAETPHNHSQGDRK